jgi:L-arabinose isomerase
MAHVSENNGRFKLVCALIDCLDGEHFLASYSHGVFRPRIPVDAFFGRIIQIGTTQHFAIADGNWIDSLRRAGELLRLDFNVLTNEKE